MSLYRETCEDLDKEELIRNFYRFEGARTLSRINTSGSGYIYVSNSLDHHMYFTMRRLKQLIDKILFETEEIRFTSTNIRSSETYPKIKKLVINNGSIDPLYSYRICCPASFERHLRENSVRNTSPKDGKRKVERVDRRVYGGGYGLSDEWKELLYYLTYFTAVTKINRNDLLELLIKMRRSGKMTNKDHLLFITTDSERYSYKINQNVLSDFNKYNIINALESIVEKGLVVEGSSLAAFPKKTIREIVDDYERGKEKTLELIRK